MRFLRSVAFWSLPVLALAMVALSLVPVDTWNKADHGPVYHGLDPNLVYTKERSSGSPNAGRVSISDDSLSLVAETASEPVAHLLTTPLSFDASMDVSITESPTASRPLRVKVWSVREKAAYYLDFGPGPNNVVTASVVEQDEVVSEVALGAYDLDQTYKIDLSLDRENQRLRTDLTSTDVTEAIGALRLEGGPDNPAYGDAVSDSVPVLAGQEYLFGGRIRVASGSDAYKIAVKWLDKDSESLGFSNTWHGSRDLQGWTDVEFDAVAPEDAAYARIFLGSGNGTTLLYTGVYLRRIGAGRNLIENSTFDTVDGWNLAENKGDPDIVRLTPLKATYLVGDLDAPDLFDSRRITLSASSFSGGEEASAQLENFSLQLPPDLWQVVKTDDNLARLLVGILLMAAVLAVGIRLGPGAWRLYVSRWRNAENAAVTLWPSRMLVTVSVLVMGYLVLNMLLMTVSRHPFDMTSAKYWTYLGLEYGLLEIYPRASTVSLAEVWNGAPYHDAVFPYMPILAYHYTGLGWLYDLTLGGPGPLEADSFGIEFTIKMANVVFGLANAVLIYLIVRKSQLGHNAALIAGAIFLFNPALWLDMTFWGATETVSLFFVLLSVWLAERDQPVGAWFALGVAALTRPQMAVLVILLGLVYLRKFSWRQNVESISWTVIGSYIIMAPFLLHFAPSFPVDYVKRMFDVQLANGAEVALVSKGAYNIWPLVTGFFEGQSGLGRLQFPEDSTLINGMGYGQVSNLIFLALVAMIGEFFLFRPKACKSARSYLPLIAVGMLGWSMFLTDMGARYFIYALGLIIASRPGIRTIPFFAIVGVLTVTITITTYGVLGGAIENVPQFAPALHSSNNILTRLVMDLYAADWFITLGVLANLAALILLAVEAALQALRARDSIEPAPNPPLVQPLVRPLASMSFPDQKA
jgi:hypothetical protein